MICLALGASLAQPVPAAEDSPRAATRTFELRIERRSVPAAQRALRATEGERVELRWSADEPLVVHLHGYDIETRVAPGEPGVTAFVAGRTGRFPVEIHSGRGPRPEEQSPGGSRHHHRALLHVEIHPR